MSNITWREGKYGFIHGDVGSHAEFFVLGRSTTRAQAGYQVTSQFAHVATDYVPTIKGAKERAEAALLAFLDDLGAMPKPKAIERDDVYRLALDEYSVIWERGQGTAGDHSQALKQAVGVVAFNDLRVELTKSMDPTAPNDFSDGPLDYVVKPGVERRWRGSMTGRIYGDMEGWFVYEGMPGMPRAVRTVFYFDPPIELDTEA